MQYFCTYFDKNYLLRALVLYRSLKETGAEFTLWALCLDDESYRIIRGLGWSGLQAISLAELEAADPEVAATKHDRTRIEYYFTLTPALPRYVLSTHPEVDIVSYLDADLRFYSDPAAVLEHLAAGSVLIIPHGFSPGLTHLEMHGRFNVGMVSFRRDADGVACLERWRERCIEWCYDRVEEGRFADQAYLDDWPDVHAGVVVLDRPGVGLAPWNVARFDIDVKSRPPAVDGHPLVFYHFHGFKGIGKRVFDDGLKPFGTMPRSVRTFLYRRYILDLEQARQDVIGKGFPVAATGRRGTGLTAIEVLRLLRRRHLLLRLGRLVMG